MQSELTVRKLFCLEKLKFYFIGHFCKQWNALAQNDRVNKDPIAIYQIVLHQQLRNGRAAEDQYILAWLIFYFIRLYLEHHHG
jgi:hypothetical protein